MSDQPEIHSLAGEGLRDPEALEPQEVRRLAGAVLGHATRGAEITEEEYEAWRESPITEWVMAGVARFARLQKHAWANESWERNLADQSALSRLKIRAQAYEDLARLSYADAVGLHETLQEEVK